MFNGIKYNIKSFGFGDIMQCCLKVNYHSLHSSYRVKASTMQSLLHAHFLLGLPFDCRDRSDIFFQNAG
jgi:hypothetical protein